MQTRILTLFTRTPLHIGAGSSVGAIDQPIVRERHTRFPVIPGTSLKGVLAGLWDGQANLERNGKGDLVRKKDSDVVWLFGSEDAKAMHADIGKLGLVSCDAFKEFCKCHGVSIAHYGAVVRPWRGDMRGSRLFPSRCSASIASYAGAADCSASEHADKF